MTALLLGLLVASAKSSYDTQRNEVIQIASKVGFLDRVLAIYGPETSQTRELLRREVESAIPRIWPDKKSQEAPTEPTGEQARAMYGSIQELAPQNDEQRSLKAQALDTAIDLSKTLWLLSAQADPSIVCLHKQTRQSSRPFWLLWSFGSPSFFLASAYLHLQTRR
jgi:hypothetical protein